MDAAQNDLVFADEIEFAGFEFLHLGDEIAALVHLFHGIHDLRAGSRIFLVREACSLAAVVLRQDLMTRRYDGFHFRRRADDSEFAFFDVF